MDNAPLRRNQPTVFKKWGQNIAILSGDAMYVMAYQLLAKTDKSQIGKVLNIFNNIAIGVCEGQQMDMDFETTQFVTQEEYLQMIELKTSVLVSGALQIGGMVGGASDIDIINLGEFGLNLGLAFQLQDDLLDTYGDSNTFGKQIGGDIVANKKTYLTVKAFSLAKGKSLDLLNSYFKAENINPEHKINGVKAVYDEMGIKEMAENKIQEYYNKAFAAYEKLRVSEERKNILRYIAENIMTRNS